MRVLIYPGGHTKAQLEINAAYRFRLPFFAAGKLAVASTLWVAPRFSKRALHSCKQLSTRWCQQPSRAPVALKDNSSSSKNSDNMLYRQGSTVLCSAQYNLPYLAHRRTVTHWVTEPRMCCSRWCGPGREVRADMLHLCFQYTYN